MNIIYKLRFDRKLRFEASRGSFEASNAYFERKSVHTNRAHALIFLRTPAEGTAQNNLAIDWIGKIIGLGATFIADQDAFATNQSSFRERKRNGQQTEPASNDRDLENPRSEIFKLFGCTFIFGIAGELLSESPQDPWYGAALPRRRGRRAPTATAASSQCNEPRSMGNRVSRKSELTGDCSL
jgi:hypothetical protein